MHFVAICLDKTDSLELRLANRAAHLDYLRAHAKTIRTCGPLLADDGETMIGSMLILDAPNREAAEAILAEDPYKKVHLFSKVEIRPWRWVIGTPL
ncbi:MAG: YciI family protein [Xanthobacteraceae bacterium]|nr:YciI family protein [Xanthobacteraceae bacterium]QYK44947.1 MAG: YciI family protein [Xanthobacteraceae bacterium]HMN52003.1 YciI family protein [Xanthobacteraceae bacterium]